MSIQQLPPQACHDLREADPSIVLVDVRTPEEFAAGHPDGALNVPIVFRSMMGMQPNNEFTELVAKLSPDPSARVILSCAVGGRSQRACEMLAMKGYQALVNMAGGFNGARAPNGQVVERGWADLGLPVARDTSECGYDALRAKHG